MFSPSCIPEFYNAHYGIINTVGLYVGYTMIRHLPVPGVKMSLYAYFYGVLDSLIATPYFKKFQPPPAPPAV
jgi:hypothetical protein